MSSYTKKRAPDAPEQSPMPTLVNQQQQRQHRRTPSGGTTNSPHPTSDHDYHYYRHSSRRSNSSSFRGFVGGADEEEVNEEDRMQVTSKPTSVVTPQHPSAVLVSPLSSSRGTKSRNTSNRNDTTNQTTIDDGTKVLISQIVATDMARQDYKEKVVAMSSGGGTSNSNHTGTTNAPLSPLSPKSMLVMKQRPPPPHRTNSSSQHSHRSTTHHSSTTNSIHSGSSSAHRRQPQFSTLSPTGSIKDTITTTARSPSTPLWNDAPVLRTPSPQRNRVSKVSHQQLLHHSPDLYVVSPKANDGPSNGPTKQQYRRPSPKKHESVAIGSFPSSPQEMSPSFGRLGIAALSVVTPSSPYRSPNESSIKTLASSKHRTEYTVTPNADMTLQEAKRREREQGPSIMSATMRAPLKKAPPSATMAMGTPDDIDRKRQARNERYSAIQAMEEFRKVNESATSGAVSRPRSKEYNSTVPSVTPDQPLAESNRRERNRVANLSSSTVVQGNVARALRPDTTYNSTSTEAQSSTPSSTTLAFGVARDDLAKRQERERGPSLFSAMVTPRHRQSLQSTNKIAASKKHDGNTLAGASNNDSDIVTMKRNERERGPTTSASATGSARFGAAPDTLRTNTGAKAQSSTPSSSTATAFGVARDDLAKRQERERGPSLFSAMVTPRQRQSLHATNRIAIPNTRDGNVGASLSNNDSDIGAMKRREREGGPALASAMGSTVTSRRRTTAIPAPASRNDPMDGVKRRERENISGRTTTRTPAFIRNTPPRSTSSEASSSLPSKPIKSSKDVSRVVFDVDDDDELNEDSAYALAMARTNLERKMMHENGRPRDQQMESSTGSPTVKTMENAGTVAIAGRNVKVEAEDQGPLLAPAIGQASQRLSPRSPSRLTASNIWSNSDIEAQAGIPLVTPGAFAVHGVSSRTSDYTSSEDSDDDYHSATDTGFEDVNGNFVPETPLEAEIYEHEVLDGAVVTPNDDEEEIVDPKILKRLRFIQISILVFALCAIGVIIGSILGFKSHSNTIGPPKVQGWNQTGVDVFGPTDEPQTLFGTAVVISGDGNRIAVTSPGTDKETALDVGEVYIMEIEQRKNGTSWKTLDVVVGPGPNNAVQTSIAMTPDSKWLAIGYARHANGSQIQIYQEVDGLWKPVSSPIIDKNGTDTAWFGYALDLSSDGKIVAIGAPQMNSANGVGSGAVLVYQQSSDATWIQMGSEIFGSTANEYFGWAISYSTSSTNGRLRLAAGSPISNETTGLVRVFDWDNTEWVQVGNDLIGNAPLNRFGESIAMSDDGSILAVGVRGSAFEVGEAKVYRDVNGVWELDDMSFLGTEIGDGFGASIAISGDGNTLAIGGPQNNLFGERAGIIYVYKYDPNSGSWKQKGSSIGSTNVAEFGISVALSSDGQRLVGGAPTTSFDGSVARAGSVLVFDSDGIL